MLASSRFVAFLTVALTLVSFFRASAEQPYEPTWESLREHQQAPEWFRDAKFGIYCHWGVYSVPAYGNEWYPRAMHDKPDPRGGSMAEHHLKTYGSPADYPYDKFVPQFKAEKFDAQEWADLFAKSGARFAGPVAEHHDGFAMWDSELTPWNAVDKGPQRDITGELASAIRARGMKFVATFHHARNLLAATPRTEPDYLGCMWDGHYGPVRANFPELLKDPQRAFLYGDMPADQFYQMWLGKLDEVINKYEPDLIWFDCWLDDIPEKTRQQFCANYLNHAAANDKQVLVTYKGEDLPQDVGVLDIEKGGQGELTDFAWLTDDTISLGSWCYTENLKVKETVVVLHSLIDIVSKNGQLLLNLSPKADGTIPENQRKVLLELGDWLRTYGEAIYDTRPFVTHGHGPTKAEKGKYGGIALTNAYSSADIRYTRNGNTVYAIQLGKPEAGAPIVLKPFASKEGQAPFAVNGVEVLGTGEKVEYQQTGEGLVLTAPADTPNDMAIVYKISID